MLKLAEDMASNDLLRAQSVQDEYLFDLLPAAWGMDDATFEQVAGLSPHWLWQWRNHYRTPTNQELARIRRLMSFHEAIMLATYGARNYSAWWQKRWREGSSIGNRSPLEAVLAGGDAVINDLERYFRSQW